MTKWLTFGVIPPWTSIVTVQVDYFNKRRVLEERQKMMYAQAEADRAKR